MYHTTIGTDLLNSNSDRPISPILQRTCQAFRNAPTRTEMCTPPLRTTHCRSSNRRTLGPAKQVNSVSVKYCKYQYHKYQCYQFRTLAPTRSRHTRHGQAIASHRILWDAITYLRLRHPPPAPKSSNMHSTIDASRYLLVTEIRKGAP